MNLNNKNRTIHKEKSSNNFKSKPKDKSNNIFITNVNYPQKKMKKNKSTSNVILNRNILLEKYRIKEKENKVLKNNFFEFMTKNTNYLDMNKFTQYFNQIEEEQKHKYDENLKIIENKKKLLKELNFQVNKNIIENYKIDIKDIELLYEKKIITKKSEIKIKKHELEMYHQLFSQTYKKNYKLKNKLETEYKYQKLYNEQHEKYSILKNTTLYKLQRQEHLLNNLNDYFEKYVVANEESVSEKAVQLNKAEFEISLIKNDIINIQNAIQDLKEKNEELEENIKLSEENYDLKKIDYFSIMKSYLKSLNKMKNIYQVLDVENVGQILEKYNTLQKDYNKNSYMIKNISLEIINLNNDLKNKKDELENIFNKIKKIKKELMSKKNNDTEERLILKKSQIKLLISKIRDTSKEKINIFTQCINNALTNIYKISESMKISAVISPFTYVNKFTDEFNCFLSEDKKSLNLDLEKEYDDKKMLKFVITLIKNLYIFFSNINTNICLYLFKKINEEKKEKRRKETEEKRRSSVVFFKPKTDDNNKNFVEIYYLKSKYILHFFEKELNYSISRLNEKKKIFMRKPKDIFKKIYSEKSTKKNFSKFSSNLLSSPENNNQNESNETSTYKESIDDSTKKKEKNEKKLLSPRNKIMAKDDFMKKYCTFYKNSLNNNKNLNESLPKLNSTTLSSHRFRFIDNFINNKVSVKLSQEKEQTMYKEKIKEKSKEITSRIKEKELMEFMEKLNKKKYNNIKVFDSKEEGIDDRDLSTEQEKKEEQKKVYLAQKALEESKKPKKYKLKSTEPEMNTILERLDDLRALELFFSKSNKNKVLESSAFNEYYFKVKRILFKAQNKLRESNISNNNLNKSTKNAYKNIDSHFKKKLNGNKVLKRNKSDFSEVNDFKRIGECFTSKGFQNMKNKTRESFYKFSFRSNNKSDKKGSINPFLSSNILK